jgi:hypothetical protein
MIPKSCRLFGQDHAAKPRHDWAISDKGSTPVLQTGGRVSITRWSTNSFPIVQWQDARLLTGQSWFESTSGSQLLWKRSWERLLTGEATRLSSGKYGIVARRSYQGLLA